ncbi:MAG: glycerol-3-phosphate acyltransferase [Betaproteobacteria bacterium RIFCSPLOWO2_12_FULL_63_13]|nr:MAG: glycerol-3-phosphate acyltransferase [Betaproteobacteria bacterium RIFCSPLOWO2_02_FULL_63_19]OGA53767.1 MAG: glycerol-3-phosphate acyltransferase [Betaproteobacteria bacterium RIFCSPLOWO2_12_FULL_63_13]
MVTAVFILIAYLVGSLSFAVLMSRAFGLPDPRSYGSGNPGATNVLRTGRRAAAVLTLLGDGGKGWLAVFLAGRFAGDWDVGPAGIAGVAIAVFAGHLFPVLFGFRGGKGVATAAGILLAVDHWLGLSVLASWIAIAVIFRLSSLAALVAAVFAPICYVLMFRVDVMAASLAAMSGLLIWRHRENVRRLLAGQEGRIGGKPENSA